MGPTRDMHFDVGPLDQLAENRPNFTIHPRDEPLTVKIRYRDRRLCWWLS
jgi:hypothetical protein